MSKPSYVKFTASYDNYEIVNNEYADLLQNTLDLVHILEFKKTEAGIVDFSTLIHRETREPVLQKKNNVIPLPDKTKITSIKKSLNNNNFVCFVMISENDMFDYLQSGYLENGPQYALNHKNFRTMLINWFSNLQQQSWRADKLIHKITNTVAKTDPNFLVGVKTPQQLLNTGVTLYNYQLNNILWMHQMEQRMDARTLKVKVPNYNFFQFRDHEYYVNVRTSQMLPGVVPEQELHINAAGLIDEVGLGKTLSMIGLILTNPDTAAELLPAEPENDNKRVINEGHPEEPQKKKQKVFLGSEDGCIAILSSAKKKGQRCGRQITDEARGLCGVHGKSKKVIVDEQFFGDVIDFEHVANPYKLQLFQGVFPKSHATLVIVPPNLYKQWKAEINTRVSPKLRVVSIATKHDYDKITYGDLLAVDVVILTTSFLINESQKKLIDDFSADHNNPEVASYNCAWEISHMKNINNLHSPLFSAIYWHRVIVDETHEIFSLNYQNTKILSIVHTIKARYKWYVSATPFPAVSTIEQFIRWATIQDTYSHGLPAVNPPNVLDARCYDVFKSLFRKNTQESVKSEFDMPPIIEEVKLLKFTNHERAIYDSYVRAGKTYRDQFLRQLCCHLKICNDIQEVIEKCTTIEQIQKALIGKHEKTLREKELEITQNEEQEQMFTIQIQQGEAAGVNIDTLRQLRHRLKLIQDKKPELQEQKRQITSTLNFLKNSIETLAKIEQGEEEYECGICMCDIEPENKGMAKCGHFFCWTCLKEMMQRSNRKCPTCTRDLNDSDIFQVIQKPKNAAPDAEVVENSEAYFKKLLEEDGTKMANIVKYIKEKFSNDTKKCIIFSYHENMLRLVRNSLANNAGIDAVLCTGNVNVRNKAIHDFKFDPTKRVILLSAEHSASGANLVEADTIILVESLYGTDDFVNDTEKQVIGRAHRLGQKNPVKVVRFIVENTADEELYRQRFKHGVPQQAEPVQLNAREI